MALEEERLLWRSEAKAALGKQDILSEHNINQLRKRGPRGPLFWSSLEPPSSAAKSLLPDLRNMASTGLPIPNPRSSSLSSCGFSACFKNAIQNYDFMEYYAILIEGQ